MTDLPPREAIRKLDPSVVNRIAAGEIIIQPANALKEMLENSIDAGATSIDIIAKDGGLKLLQISDNGSGIPREDLPLLCERFATSKLRSFEDLALILTYGFRGEALASISHISHLSVVSKVRESPLAYKAFYLNGGLCSSKFKSGAELVEPRPIAGVDGTLISVEDLFYNLALRLRSFRSKLDEWAKILDVAGRYAIHSTGVGLSCKKFGESIPAISIRPQALLKERVRTVFGTSVASELIEFTFESTDFGLKLIRGAVSGFNYNNKRRTPPVFFINNRLVSCDPLKRAINSVFQFFLPKGNYPFVYLSLEIIPQNLDVNVHPTKREVRFLNEDEIIEWVCGQLHDVLSKNDGLRTFKQATFKRASAEEPMDEVASTNKKYRQENKLVRVDHSQLKISQFVKRDFQAVLSKAGLESQVPKSEDTFIGSEELDPDESNQIQTQRIPKAETPAKVYSDTGRERKEIHLDSVQDLREELVGSIHRPLTNVFNNLVYVGLVNSEKRLLCFQYDVKLFLCDYGAMLNDFFYQIALSEFSNYGEYALEEPVSISTILEPLYAQNDNLVPLNTILEQLEAMSDMFEEYFQLRFENGSLCMLPLLVRGYEPPLEKLPHFIYRLATKVNYESEAECLEEIMRQIALFYVPARIVSETNEESQQLSIQKTADLSSVLENDIIPLVRKSFIASELLLDLVVQVADLPGLYKVFERC